MKNIKFLRTSLIKVVVQETVHQDLNLQVVGSTPVFKSVSQLENVQF